MATREIKNAKDLNTGELIYFKSHAKATYMSDGKNVEDKINSLSSVATSGSYNDLEDKPIIPNEVTESTVNDWGFTKNTGTVTNIKINNSTKSPSNGIIDLGTVLTEIKNESVTEDKLTAELKNNINLIPVINDKVEVLAYSKQDKASRNLIVNSNFDNGGTIGNNLPWTPKALGGGGTLESVHTGHYNGYNAAQLQYIIYGQPVMLEEGKTYTLSCMYIADGSNNSYIDYNNLLGEKNIIDSYNVLIDSSGIRLNSCYTYNKAYITFSVSQTSERVLAIGNTDISGHGGLFISCIQLEEGNVATEYKRAEETYVTTSMLKDTVNSLPDAVTESTVSDWGFTKNVGTITGVSANGTTIATSGVVNIPEASTSTYGVTKLSSSTSSTSTSLAATASAVKSAYDLANGRQEKLVSGTNIKTINGEEILGDGDITIKGGGSYNIQGLLNIRDITSLETVWNSLTENGETATYIITDADGNYPSPNNTTVYLDTEDHILDILYRGNGDALKWLLKNKQAYYNYNGSWYSQTISGDLVKLPSLHLRTAQVGDLITLIRQDIPVKEFYSKFVDYNNINLNLGTAERLAFNAYLSFTGVKGALESISDGEAIRRLIEGGYIYSSEGNPNSGYTPNKLVSDEGLVTLYTAQITPNTQHLYNGEFWTGNMTGPGIYSYINNPDPAIPDREDGEVYTGYVSPDGTQTLVSMKNPSKVFTRSNINGSWNKISLGGTTGYNTKYPYGSKLDDCLETGVCAYTPDEINGINENWTLFVNCTTDTDGSGYYHFTQKAICRTGDAKNIIFERLGWYKKDGDNILDLNFTPWNPNHIPTTYGNVKLYADGTATMSNVVMFDSALPLDFGQQIGGWNIMTVEKYDSNGDLISTSFAPATIWFFTYIVFDPEYTLLFYKNSDTGVWELSKLESTGITSGGTGTYPEINHGTSDTTFTLTPNTFHIWGEVPSLDISFAPEIEGIANEYIFQFSSGSTPTVLNINGNVKWADIPNMSANKTYQISVLKGLASIMEFS